MQETKYGARDAHLVAWMGGGTPRITHAVRQSLQNPARLGGPGTRTGFAQFHQMVLQFEQSSDPRFDLTDVLIQEHIDFTAILVGPLPVTQ